MVIVVVHVTLQDVAESVVLRPEQLPPARVVGGADQEEKSEPEEATQLSTQAKGDTPNWNSYLKRNSTLPFTYRFGVAAEENFVQTGERDQTKLY